MDFEEMNQRAYDRKPEPDGLTPAERMIWLALRLLYELHFHGGLTREEGVAYKQELKKITSAISRRRPSGCVPVRRSSCCGRARTPR